MKCEYCDSVFDDEISLETCPNCGGVFSEEDYLADMPDEEKRKRLQASGVRYCPHCLSTNVARRKFFAEKGCLGVFIFTCIIAVGFFAVMPWFVLVLALMLLCEWMLTAYLCCGDCKLQWLKNQAKDYERYYSALHIAMMGKPKVQYSGINKQKLVMDISSFTINRPKKSKTVLYRNITAVEHREPAGDIFGYLSIRCGNKNVAMPQSYDEAQADPMTILYEPSQVRKYRKVHTALQQIVHINNNGGLLHQ